MLMYVHAGVIVNGGTKPNIIPELTELDFYFRPPTMRELEELKTRATACFQGAATASGCEVHMHRPTRNIGLFIYRLLRKDSYYRLHRRDSYTICLGFIASLK
jgi:acetylornithine deacetylase/succinyl-diaminopimelate desuccinylase-like protein